MARRFDLSDPDLDHLLRWVQCGVVSRRQLEELGATPADIERLLRRRELVKAHRGVYLNHTGELTWEQREWVAVLAAWPAALAHESALPNVTSPVVHLAVHPGRAVSVPPRVRLHRTRHLDERVDWRGRPPRIPVSDALIDVMSRLITEGDVAGAFARLTTVAHTRQTCPDWLLAALAARQRIGGRATIEAMVTDLRDGVCSVLERGYFEHVERPHGLPRGTRQFRSSATGRRTDQDVRYQDQGVVVELDGRGFHDNPAAWDDDARRDLAELAVSDAVTARVTYGLVFRDACRTASWIARLLRRRGWTGTFRRCPRCPGDL